MIINNLKGCWKRDGSWLEQKIRQASQSATPKIARRKAIIDCGVELNTAETKLFDYLMKLGRLSIDKQMPRFPVQQTIDARAFLQFAFPFSLPSRITDVAKPHRLSPETCLRASDNELQQFPPTNELCAFQVGLLPIYIPGNSATQDLVFSAQPRSAPVAAIREIYWPSPEQLRLIEIRPGMFYLECTDEDVAISFLGDNTNMSELSRWPFSFPVVFDETVELLIQLGVRMVKPNLTDIYFADSLWNTASLIAKHGLTFEELKRPRNM